ncbi:DNA polymerase III subunit gamma and tau [Thermocrispum municipale]|uniref:DNA polymerase III subunit gamma and tau n=1 Tax=Thermocrispum municipale TaxID=37926 RepID=UPI0003F87994|nr:DNA polymerase III subunit gamma and tau [Thermocrispum municipale]
MALALYRKYRPATFAEVVGQEHVTEPLRAALASGRINHAYLFSGPRGCGKTSSARIMARSLNCEQGPTPDPCGECASCINLAPEGPGTVDVVELDAASHGGVDDARELRDRAFYSPAESRYRVFIIDEAHMVTTQGFNALLKIVEEPPEHLIFIFATTEPDKVLTTIRSRTHHYPFRLIPPSAMRQLLERTVEAEGVKVEPAVYPLVIRAGGGSARDTQSVLDQLLSGAGPEGVTYERAAAILGVTDSALLDDLVDGLSADDPKAVFGTIERLVDAGHDPRRFASDLLDRLRDLVLLRAVPDAAARGLVAAPEDQLERMAAQAERIGPATLTRYAEIVHNGLLDMRGATAPRLVLELLCARMLLPSAEDSEAAVLQRLERLERRMTAGNAAAETSAQQVEEPAPRYQRPSARQAEPARSAEPARAPQPSRPPEPAARVEPPPERRPAERPQPPAQPAQPAHAAPAAEAQSKPGAPGELDATALRGVWSELLQAIRKKSRSTEAMMTNATVQSVQGGDVTLTHPAEPLARRLSEPRNADVIASALTEVLGGEWRVRCLPAGSGGPSMTAQASSRPAPKPPSRPAQAEPEVPLPPEPPEEDEDLYAEEPKSLGTPQPEKPDPGAAAMKLLSDQLGARPLE